MPLIVRARILLSCLFLLVAMDLVAAEYPAALAGEIAQYPQAQIESIDEDAVSAGVVLITRDTVDAAAQYYRDALLAKGWKQTLDAAIGTARAQEFTRDKSSIAITIMPSPSGTAIALTLNF